MTVVESLAGLYNLASPTDGDVVCVNGFWEKNDGGGGVFIFDGTSTVNPVFNDVNYFKIGFNANYDGMVCKSAATTTGRWIRQWNRGKLNLRWFGALPDFSSSSRDTSLALNAALEYAQFDVKAPPLSDPGTNIFNYEVYTRPGKTIFIPAGRYYFFSAVSSIYYGVVIEGEGNMGTSAHGTRLLIFHEYTTADETITGIGRDGYGFLRFYANEANNSGGGIKDLTISVENVHPNNPDGTPSANDTNNGYDSNVILLMAPDKTPPSGLTYCPAVSKWKAENVVFAMRARARRAVYMRSYQETGDLPWRIRDTSLINCWFAGARLEGETVRAINSSGLHVIGGFFSSGLGVDNIGIIPGIVLGGEHGCANTHLSNVDLTHAAIKIDKISIFTNINCRFAKLLIYDGAGNDHQGLHISKQYMLNKRNYPALDSLGNPNPLLCSTNLPANYKCYQYPNSVEDTTGIPASWTWE